MGLLHSFSTIGIRVPPDTMKLAAAVLKKHLSSSFGN